MCTILYHFILKCLNAHTMSANFTLSGKFYDFVENKKMCAMHMSSFCVLKCLEHRFLVPGKRFLVPEHMFWSQETAETRFLSHETPPFNGYAGPTLVTQKKWDLGRLPPPCFFSKSPHFPVFFLGGGRPLNFDFLPD